jgi:hypothetical protein
LSRRIALAALAALAVGLPLHNLALAELWDTGLRGNALDAVSAWKELVLAAGLVALTFGLPARIRLARIDLLALAYAAVVLVWAVLPQDWLGGEAHAKGILYAVRHDLTPVAAYFLGRGLALSGREVKRVALLVGISAAAVAVWGLVDVYAVSLDWWRASGAPGWFGEQLGLEYNGLSGLPENFVYNPGNEEPVRRLVSTFLSPLATAYMLVVALLAAAAWPRSRRLVLLAPLLAAGLLFTDSRSAIAALAVGLVALAWAQRRWWPVVAAVAVLAGGAAFVKAFQHIGPETRFTPAELVYLRENAARNPGASHDPLSAGESSASSHLRNLRDGIETVLRHPQGYGPGNAGVTAFRTGVELKAGESTYTELGVEAGLLGALLFVAWSLALLRVALAREPWIGASLAAVLALGLQTDVIGVHWLAFVLWALAGSTLPAWRSIPASTSATST